MSVALSVLPVKLMNVCHAGGQVILGFPGITLRAVTSPPDQILYPPLPVPAPVNDPFHLQDTQSEAINDQCNTYFDNITLIPNLTDQ